MTYLEAFVLEDLLDCNVFSVLSTGYYPCLKDDTKRTVSDDFGICICKFKGIACLAILS